MLYMITGLMGSGKTLNAIKFVSEDKTFQGRQVYYHRIQDLDTDKTGWIEIDDTTLKHWRETIPDGSVVVVDEADHIFPQRSKGEVPIHIRELKETRRRGLDFVFITQQPSQLDVFLRRNIGHFIHLERPFGAKFTNWYEWPKYVDPEDRINRGQANKKRIKLDQKYFGYYKSAEQHTHNLRVPWGKIASVGVAITVAVGIMIYIITGMLPDSPESDTVANTDSVPASEQPSTVRQLKGETTEGITIEDATAYIARHTPRIADIPWSAPVFDEVVKVQSFPRPQCIRVESGRKRGTCICYSQQATLLDTDASVCNAIVDHGYFQPYAEDPLFSGEYQSASSSIEPVETRSTTVRQNAYNQSIKRF